MERPIYEDITEKVHQHNAYAEYLQYVEILQDVVNGDLLGRKQNGEWWQNNSSRIRPPTLRNVTKEEMQYLESEEYYELSRGWFCQE